MDHELHDHSVDSVIGNSAVSLLAQHAPAPYSVANATVEPAATLPPLADAGLLPLPSVAAAPLASPALLRPVRGPPAQS